MELTAYDTGRGPIGAFNNHQADVIRNVVLGTSSVSTLTIPASIKLLMIRSNQPIFYRIDGDPVVPAVDITSDGSIFIPKSLWEGVHWTVGGVAAQPTNIRFIRALASDTIITVALFTNVI